MPRGDIVMVIPQSCPEIDTAIKLLRDASDAHNDGDTRALYQLLDRAEESMEQVRAINISLREALADYAVELNQMERDLAWHKERVELLEKEM